MPKKPKADVDSDPMFDTSDEAMAEAKNSRLQEFCERIERLDEEAKNISADKRDVMAEAKAVGFDTKIVREMLKLRKMEPDVRREFELVRDTYKAELGID